MTSTSSEGTFVNDQEVRGLVVLHTGDRLRLGSLEIVIPGMRRRP